jgi:hypothetical protein
MTKCGYRRLQKLYFSIYANALPHPIIDDHHELNNFNLLIGVAAVVEQTIGTLDTSYLHITFYRVIFNYTSNCFSFMAFH